MIRALNLKSFFAKLLHQVCTLLNICLNLLLRKKTKNSGGTENTYLFLLLIATTEAHADVIFKTRKLCFVSS